MSAEWLEERHRLGHDLRDEMWEGVLHMVTQPSFAHPKMGGELLAFLGQLLEPRGIEMVHTVGVFRPGTGNSDYRVPDLVFFPVNAEPGLVTERGIEGAPLAVAEILSLDDESYDKLPFYASLGVREVLIVHPDTRVAEVYRLSGATYLAVSADEQGRVHAETIDVRFRTVPGPRLRVECDSHHRDI